MTNLERKIKLKKFEKGELSPKSLSNDKNNNNVHQCIYQQYWHFVTMFLPTQLAFFSLNHVVEFGCLKVVNPMSYLTVGSLENTSRLVDVSLNWTINSTG